MRLPIANVMECHMLTNTSPFELDDVVLNAEIVRRPSRRPDYEAENNALKALARTMVESPQTILQKLVETAHRLCNAHTAGISLLEEHDGQEVFRWEALAGVFADRLNNTMPRHASPCGTTIDRNATQLMYMAERVFPALKAQPPVVEALLVPFHVDNKPVGTVWIVAHDESRKFDREDERITKVLAQFASAGWQLCKARADAEQRSLELDQRVSDQSCDLENSRRKLAEAHVLGALGTAAAKIIHDLANPLNAISVSIQLLQRYLATDAVRPEIATVLNNLNQENDRVHKLTDELRQFTRPLELDLDAVNVGSMLLQVIHTVCAVGKNSHIIEIEPQTFEGLAMVKADPEKLMRVFLNLCKNSLEAMPDGGRLVIRCYERDKHIVVEIQDTGCGVPTDMNLFEPFATSKANGWGLGLSIVRQIVIAHGGMIDYTSELGKGTTFLIGLPLTAVQ
jgi:signal transduction histidine kinase